MTPRDLYASFAAHEVKYVVIGGVAAARYGLYRVTVDLDIAVEASAANVERLMQALMDAGMTTASPSAAQDILRQDITVFDDALRVDVFTRAPGLVFAEAWARRRTEMVQGVPVHFASLDDLIASKQAAGRPVDLEDVATLRAIAERQAHPDEE